MDGVYSDGFLTELVLSTVIFLLVFKILPIGTKNIAIEFRINQI